MHDKIYEAALSKVNELRAIRNIGAPLLEFPKGKLMKASSCPIQKALQCSAVVGSIVFWYLDSDVKNDVVERVDQAIGKFVQAFDEGKYPELIEE